MLNEIRNNQFLNLFEKMFGNKLEEHLYVESCIFIKENSQLWEEGILINSTEKLIDLSGQEVETIEDIRITEDLLIDIDNIQFDY